MEASYADDIQLSRKEQTVEPVLLTMNDMCGSLKVGPTTINTMVREGKVRVVWVNGCRRFPVSERNRLANPDQTNSSDEKLAG